MTSFHDELANLKQTLLRMFVMSESALRRAVKSVLERDLEAAQAVMDEDSEIDAMECDLDRLSLRLLALDQPVATDLRFIVAAMRVTSDVERIGDEAVNIAERSVILYDRPPLEKTEQLRELAEVTQRCVADAIRAFNEQDAELAEDICNRSHKASAITTRIFREVAEMMLAEARLAERGVQVNFIAHALKRITQQCANVAENVIFIVRGENVKHACLRKGS